MYSVSARDHFNCSPLLFSIMTSTTKQMRPNGKGGGADLYKQSTLFHSSQLARYFIVLLSDFISSDYIMVSDNYVLN